MQQYEKYNYFIARTTHTFNQSEEQGTLQSLLTTCTVLYGYYTPINDMFSDRQMALMEGTIYSSDISCASAISGN